MIEYFISVDEMAQQDEHVWDRLRQLVLERAYDKAEELGAKLDSRYAPMFSTSQSTRTYDEDGHPIGNHVMLSVCLMEDLGDA